MDDFEPLMRRRDVDVEDMHGDGRLDGGGGGGGAKNCFSGGGSGSDGGAPAATATATATETKMKSPRLASLDVFRGLSVFLMMFVDYSVSIFPVIGHSPWNGVHLADFVMLFFLFVAGISLAFTRMKVQEARESERRKQCIIRLEKSLLLKSMMKWMRM